MKNDFDFDDVMRAVFEVLIIPVLFIGPLFVLFAVLSPFILLYLIIFE
jgi:hypothetical protein